MTVELFLPVPGRAAHKQGLPEYKGHMCLWWVKERSNLTRMLGPVSSTGVRKPSGWYISDNINSNGPTFSPAANLTTRE